MRVERSVDIAARQRRVWEVLSDLEAWPRRIETVELVELLTPAPPARGSRVRLEQPKLPAGTWEVIAWDPPSSFELRQRASGVTSVAGHRVEALDEERSRLTLSLDVRGFITPVIALFSKRMINRYLASEAQGMKQAAESPDP